MRHWHKSSKKIHVVSVPTVGLCVCPWLDLSAVKTLKTNCATRYSEAKQCLKGVALSCCRRWSKCLSVLNKCFCFTVCVQCFWKNKVNCIPLKELEEGWCDPRAPVHAEFAKVFGQRCGDQVKIKSFSNYSLRIWRISLNFEIFCWCYYKQLLSALITCFFCTVIWCYRVCALSQLYIKYVTKSPSIHTSFKMNCNSYIFLHTPNTLAKV